MKIVFAGTPEFAQLAYEAIIQAGYEVPLVLTQPDRKSGRGMKLSPTAVKSSALKHGSEVMQPLSLRLDGKYSEQAEQVKTELEQLQPDVIVVAAYGLILPQWVLDLPRYGCLNIHASLLPRWRGAAPIQRAIEAGDQQTGIGIMQMEAGLDTGAILLEKELLIKEKNAAQLHDELATLGAQAIVEVLQGLPENKFPAIPQATEGITYAHKLTKEEARLNLNESAKQLALKIRAFNPVPGASINLVGFEQPIKIWQAKAIEKIVQAEVGEILKADKTGIEIATGQGVLELIELQKPGGKRQTAQQFVQGWRFKGK